MKKFNIQEVKDYIQNSSETTKIYVGADSFCRKKNENGQIVWYADYTVAVVVHRDGNKGAKVFGSFETERIYDQKKNKPSLRLMTEVHKATEMLLNIADAIGDRHFELHLDISPDEINGSNAVMQQAIGYVKGMVNIVPMIKPNAPAASYCADRLEMIKGVNIV